MHSLESNANIPTFILKLWKLVCDESSNDLIQWNRNGRSFIINDQARFAKEILPLYFKHSNMASFIRQLNMYGFRKVSNIEQGGLKSDADGIEFFHPFFTLGQEDQLQYIKRKMSNNNSKTITSIVKVDEIQDILADVESIKGRQDSVDTLLNNMKQENEALWREIAILRQKHIKQQQIVDKLLQFLVSIVQNRVVGGMKRKAPILIDPAVSNNRKIIKPNKETGNAICIASSSSSAASTSGPIIHDITDMEETASMISNSPSSSMLELPINIENDDDQTTCKQQQQNNKQDQSQSNDETTSNRNSVKDFKDSLITLPENILELDLMNQTNNQLLDEHQTNLSYNPANFVLNTPRVSHYEEQTGANAISIDSSNNGISTSKNIAPATETFSNTDLVPKQKIAGQSTPKLTSENFTDHVEGIESELSWLQDQLYGGNLNIDPSTLLGLFAGENQLEGLDASTAAKAIMDGSGDGADAETLDNKLIKVEDSNDSTNLFDGLDLGNIGNDTKGFLEFCDAVGDDES